MSRISPGDAPRNRPPLLPTQAEAVRIEDVDVEAPSRVDDAEAGPSPRQLIVEFRRLPPHFLELPIAERQALPAPHLLRDVAVDGTVEVLRIEVEGELLAEKVAAAPRMRIVDARLACVDQRGIDIPVVVHAFGQVLRQERTQAPRAPHVVHDERHVLQGPEAPRVDPRMTAHDERVCPVSGGPGHPALRRPVVHPIAIECASRLEGGRFQVSGQLVPSAHHAPGTAATRKACSSSRYGWSSGSQSTWDPSSSASRRAIAARESSKSKTCAFSRIRSGRTDFGITTRPCWSPQRIRTWAGVCPYSAARALITGWSSRCPRVSGL